MSPANPGSVLLAAQQSALSHDERLQTLSLRSLQRGVPALPVTDRIVRAEVTLTIDGASTLELDIHDPNWQLERSGVLDPDGNGILNAVAVAVDGIPFRLADARRDPGSPVITLEFEDLAMALLDIHNKKMSASRGSRTRAQFVEQMVREVKDRDLAFWSPDKISKQPVAKPDLPSTAPKQGETGFDAGATFKIKDVLADAAQMSEVATALGVADQEGASDRVKLAMLCAGIGESGFRAVPNAQGSGYEGVFQADPHKIPRTDTEQQARYFLKGDKGFQAGGAMAAARAHPDWSAGTIATHVEASGEPGSFYDAYHAEAKAILGLWGSNAGAGSDPVLRFKQYRFTRGLPGHKETSRQAAQRLAEEVNWRFYAIGGLVVFSSDDQMISQPAGLILEPTVDDQGTITPPAGLLAMPGYEWLHGKLPAQVELRVVANAWSVFPGEVVVLRGMGQLTGRWIVETFRFNLLDATAATVQLIKPLPQRKEPAPEAITVDTGTDALPAGAQRAIAWAASRVGHYAEEFGSNRGQELDALEAKFGLNGAPWCAIFATTALVHGGVPRDCRTAAVKDINDWCQAGTHGYTRGYRQTPRPGDLMVFDNDHVVLVEKVRGDTVQTIDGNPSAGKVVRGQRLISTGRFVRPDYRS